MATHAPALYRRAGLIASHSWRLTIGEQGAWRDIECRSAPSIAASTFLPRGAYTTLRSYGGTGLLLLEEHLTRLETSAEFLGHPTRLDRAALRDLLCKILREQGGEAGRESRLRLTLDCSRYPGELWVSLEPLAMPSVGEVEEGVAVLTREIVRKNPRAKDTAFIEQSRNARALINEAINEVLMVSPDGRILEGLSSNFFGVRDGILYTADEGILPGLTRSLVLDEAERARIPLRREPVLYGEVSLLDEAFISSSSRGILPVTLIDGRQVGDGARGAITCCLQERYTARIKKEVDWVCATVSDGNTERSRNG